MLVRSLVVAAALLACGSFASPSGAALINPNFADIAAQAVPSERAGAPLMLAARRTFNPQPDPPGRWTRHRARIHHKKGGPTLENANE